MGRIIDRAVVLTFTATGLYLLFLRAFDNIFLACALAFACCAGLMCLVRRSVRGARMSALQAQTLLDQWAFGNDENAKRQIARLLSRPEHDIIYLPKHPSAALSIGDIFGAWKSCRDRESLVIAAPCRADGRARAFAQTLKAPNVELADAPRLISLIRRSDLTPPRVQRAKGGWERLKQALRALPHRRPWHQNLLSGLALMGLYLLTGNPAYLFLSIGCLFLTGIAHHSRT